MKTYKIAFSLVLSLTSLYICKADNIVLTKSQKIALEVARSYSEIQSSPFLSYYKFLNFSLNSASEVIVDYHILGDFLDSEDYFGSLNEIYTLRGSNNEAIKTVIDESPSCTEKIMNISYLKDKVKINTKLKTYIMTLENDKVILAEEMEFGNYVSSFEKYRYKFSYNADGKISSIQTFKVIGKGKNYREAVEKDSYILYDKKLEYIDKENKVIITVLNYFIAKTMKSPKLPYLTSAIVITDRQNNYLIENYHKGVSAQKSSTSEFFFDNHYILSKINKNDFIQHEIETREYRYNSMGVRDTMIIKVSKENGEFEEHMEIAYTYNLKPNGNQADICSYDVKYLMKFYDKNGVVYKEDNGKYRELINGVWSDWKFHEL